MINTMILRMTLVLPIVLSVTTSVAVFVTAFLAVSMIVSVAARGFTAKVEVAIARVQNLHLDQVEDEAHHGNDEHDVALDLRRLKEAHGCLIE